MKDEIIIEDFVDNGVIELEERMHMPVLENLTIIPSTKEQRFKSKKDGFNEVVVEGVEGDELTIIPTTEEQINEGLFDKVIVKKVTSDIDKNIRPEIIRENEEILGVVGSYKGIDTSDATVTADDILKGKTAYANNEQITGTIEEYDGTYTGDASSIGELEKSFISSIDDSLGANTTKLPDSLTSIGQYAFYNCTNLALTKLPEGITSIGEYAFQSCPNLALTKLPDSLTYIGRDAFHNCTNLVLTELPDGLTIIDTAVFQGCTNLALTKLPEGLTNLRTNAFLNCTNLAITEIPEKITTFSSSVFQGCASLSEITCKGMISSFSSTLFKDCTNLVKLVLPNITKVPSLQNTSVFTGTPIANGTGYIYVPDNFVEDFKVATNWSTYSNQIKPISELEG